MGKINKRVKPCERKFGTKSVILDGKPDIQDKFRKAQQDLNNQLSLDQDTKLNKILGSNIGPIVRSYYMDDPVVKTKQPFHTLKQFDKGVTSVRRALLGTLFKDTDFSGYWTRKFTVQEILDSISVHKCAMSPLYKPQDKKYLRIHLDQFMYNPYAKSIGKSFLIYWMNNIPISVIIEDTDYYSDVTQEFIALFGWGDLPVEYKNKVIKGVAQYMDILKGFQFSPVYRVTAKLKAQILYEILKGLFSYIGSEFSPFNMVSPRFETWIREGLVKSQYIK